MSFDHRKWLANAEKSRESHQEAIRLNPEDARGYCGLGWALYNLGKYSEAEEPLRRASTLNPDDYYTHYHLGLILGELQRFPESEDELVRSIQNSNRDVAIIHDLWNLDKHAELDGASRSGLSPRLLRDAHTALEFRGGGHLPPMVTFHSFGAVRHKLRGKPVFASLQL